MFPIFPIGGASILGKLAYDKIPLPFSLRTHSPKLREFLRNVEGLGSTSQTNLVQVPIDKFETYSGKLYKYKDHKGFWTIGFGHLMQSGEKSEITVKEAWNLFDYDLEKKRKDANKVFGNTLVSQGQYDALVSLTFNGGGGMFSGTNFLNKILNGKLIDARLDLDFWSGDSSGLGLTRRRMVEHLFYLGKSFKYNHPSKITLADAQAFRQTKSLEILKKYEA